MKQKPNYEAPKRGGFTKGRLHSPDLESGVKRVKMNLTIDPELYEQAQRFAREQRLSISAIVEYLLRRELETTEPVIVAANGKLGRG